MPGKSFKGATIAILLPVLLFTAAVSRAGDDLEGRMVKKRPFSFFLPAKWQTPFAYVMTRKKVRRQQEFVYTKDGFSLDVIEFKARPIKTALEHTKKVIAPGMSPFEMAQLVINDFELNKMMQALKIHENKPFTVCGRPGFRIVYSYTDNGTLAYKSVYYGFQRRNTYYTIRYEAPAIHYFDTYLPTFEKMARSATLILRDSEVPEDGQEFTIDESNDAGT